jgi:tetratricopeptide (TPR) repeat protein
MYLTLGRLEEADRHSLWALESKRDSADAWALRGDCFNARGKADEALAAYHRALALQPDYPAVQMEAAEIYRRQGRYDRLLATLDRLQEGIGMEQTPPRVDVLQGIAMRKVGRFEEAKRSFLRAAQKDPENDSPHIELAALALERGDTASAQNAFAEAVRLNPSLAQGQDWMQQLELEQARLATDPRQNSLPPIR